VQPAHLRVVHAPEEIGSAQRGNLLGDCHIDELVEGGSFCLGQPLGPGLD
jgi:hypothetical protein